MTESYGQWVSVFPLLSADTCAFKIPLPQLSGILLLLETAGALGSGMASGETIEGKPATYSANAQPGRVLGVVSELVLREVPGPTAGRCQRIRTSGHLFALFLIRTVPCSKWQRQGW